MKLTVGSLSPGVYWRRRAVVLGGVLIMLIITTYACSGQSGAGQNKSAQNGKGVASSSPGPSVQATLPLVLTPSPGEVTTGAPPFGNNQGAGGGGAGATGSAPSGGASSQCTDSEIAVTPNAEPSPVRQGQHAKLYLRVRNVSTRACVRDVGAQMQELYIQQQDRTTVWTSDKCAARKGDFVVTFAPNQLEEYALDWDGKATNQGCDNRPPLAPGTYKLYARVGSKISEPVALTIAA
jgi:hypothetical protein